MKRNGFTLSELAIVVALLLFAAWIFVPWGHLGRSHHNRDRAYCQSNLKHIGFGFKQYIQDYDERFPSLSTVAGWRDAVGVYVKDDAQFHCPSAGDDPRPQTADYWFNARMSGIREEVLDSQALTVMLGDGYSSADPRVSLSQLPKSWLDDPKSPARRHLDGMNFAFADGHVKWLRPEKISTQSPKNGVFAFTVR